MAATPSVSHTCGSRSAESSSSTLPCAGADCAGTWRWISHAAASALQPTSAKAARQPKNSPAQVASGTPTTVAAVSPVITSATDVARRPGGASAAATRAAAPKYVPCGSPATKRSAIRDGYPGASALAKLPSAYASIIATSSQRRCHLAVSTASTGAPTITPAAYALMARPACAMFTCRPLATSGSKPMMTNSPVPMPKPPTAMASMAATGKRSGRASGAAASQEGEDIGEKKDRGLCRPEPVRVAAKNIVARARFTRTCGRFAPCSPTRLPGFGP